MTDCVLDHHDPAPAEAGRLCLDHYSRLRSQLLALPAVTNWLHVNVAAAATPGDYEHVTGSRDDPIPLRVDVLDLIGPDSLLPAVSNADDQAGAEAVRAMLAYHATTVHTEGGFEFPPVTAVMFDGHVIGEYAGRSAADEDCRYERWLRRRLDDPRRWAVTVRPARAGWPSRATAEQLAGYVAGNLSWVAEQPWVSGLVEDVRAATSQAHRLAPWRAQTQRDPDPCQKCKRSTVVLHLAAGESRCEKRAGGCGRRQPLSEYVMNALLLESRRSA